METLISLESKFTKMIERTNQTMNDIIQENNSKFDAIMGLLQKQNQTGQSENNSAIPGAPAGGNTSGKGS